MTSDDSNPDPAPPVPRSIGRVLDLLEIVLAQPRNLTACANAAQLTPTTALRHLRALEARGYVTRDRANVYTTGPTIRRLSATVRDDGNLDSVVDAVQPYLESLAAATGESAYLAVGDGRDASYVAAAQSDRAIRHVAWIGQTVPLDTTAVGAAMREPGVAMFRPGAVEPDISAVSIGLPPTAGLTLAISVIGPTSRFTDQAEAHAAALERVVSEFTAQVGLGGHAS